MPKLKNSWQPNKPLGIDNVTCRCIKKQYFALGTQIELTAFGTATEQDLDDAYQLIQGYEARLTVNRDHSEIMAINQNAGKAAVQVSSSTYSLVKLAINISKENFGFNTTIGPLVKLWKIGFAGANVPNDNEIQKRLSLTDPNKVVLNDNDQSVKLLEPQMQLDLGGIAKGYIADRIRDLWRSRGIQSGMINLGGNLLTMGPCPLHSDKLWSIGVQNPDENRGKIITSIKHLACSAVTSGIYERFLKQNKKVYHHIIDPQTGYPLKTDLAGVTVFTHDSVIGEIESTRLFFAGKAPKNWLTKNPNIYGAIFVYKDQHIKKIGFNES